MLEPISLGQGRTHCPGLAADERGVVMGRRLALFFPDVARAVGFFRSYSREVTLDEILASLQIQEAVSERGGREIMVRFEVAGSFAADRAVLFSTHVLQEVTSSCSRAILLAQGRVVVDDTLEALAARDPRASVESVVFGLLSVRGGIA